MIRTYSHSALTSFNIYIYIYIYIYNKNSAPLNLIKEDFASLKLLSKNDSLILPESDKRNSKGKGD